LNFNQYLECFIQFVVSIDLMFFQVQTYIRSFHKQTQVCELNIEHKPYRCHHLKAYDA